MQRSCWEHLPPTELPLEVFLDPWGQASMFMSDRAVGMMPRPSPLHMRAGATCFRSHTLLRVAKTPQLQEAAWQILPIPLLPPHSTLDHLPLASGMAGTGNPFSLVIFSLGATSSCPMATPGPAWGCQSPVWAEGTPLLGAGS